MSQARYITVKGDRWDTIAHLAYGDATKYIEIIKANPAIPIRGELPSGIIVNVPIISGEELPTTSNLPPWKR